MSLLIQEEWVMKRDSDSRSVLLNEDSQKRRVYCFYCNSLHPGFL